jgi:hypothetical protein
MSTFMPKLFRWVFSVLAVLAALAAAAILVVLAIDPTLPPDARFGPVRGDVLGQPAVMALRPDAKGQGQPALTMTAFRGNLAMTVDEPAGVVELLKRYGLPLLLISAVFFTALFELLRRLFRNVGHGKSFTPQSVRLVQIIGASLVVFSLLFAVGESWFAYAMYSYLVEHTEIAISGTPVRLPQAATPPWLGHGFPFGSTAFFSGLLVLALAEVFRQGLALQRDNELTV